MLIAKHPDNKLLSVLSVCNIEFHLRVGHSHLTMTMIYDLIIDSNWFILLLLDLPVPQCRKATVHDHPTGDPKDETKYCAACGNYDGNVLGVMISVLHNRIRKRPQSWVC